MRRILFVDNENAKMLLPTRERERERWTGLITYVGVFYFKKIWNGRAPILPCAQNGPWF